MRAPGGVVGGEDAKKHAAVIYDMLLHCGLQETVNKQPTYDANDGRVEDREHEDTRRLFC